MCVRGTCLAAACVTLHVYPESIQLLPLLLSLVFSHPCGQALERQKEYFDCIRNERDELRDELADIKGKSKAGEVGPQSPRTNKGHRKESFLGGGGRVSVLELNLLFFFQFPSVLLLHFPAFYLCTTFASSEICSVSFYEITACKHYDSTLMPTW